MRYYNNKKQEKIPKIPDKEIQCIFLIVRRSLKNLRSLLIVIFYGLDKKMFYTQLVSFLFLRKILTTFFIVLSKILISFLGLFSPFVLSLFRKILISFTCFFVCLFVCLFVCFYNSCLSYFLYRKNIKSILHLIFFIRIFFSRIFFIESSL